MLYAPGIRDYGNVSAPSATSVSKPVYMLAQPHFTLAPPRVVPQAGVRRVSLGSNLSTAIFGALRTAVRS